MQKQFWVGLCVLGCAGNAGEGDSSALEDMAAPSQGDVGDASESSQPSVENGQEGTGDVSESSPSAVAEEGMTDDRSSVEADGVANAADTGSAAEAEDTADESTSASPTGEELYLTYCSACHGPDAAGTAIAPEVQHPTADFARWVVRNGLSGTFDTAMPAYESSQITEAELDRILDFLRSLPEASSSEALYLDYCGNCHGQDARGGPSRKNIAGKDEFAEVVRQGKGGDAFEARTRYMPSWTRDELENTVIAELERYVGSLPE